MTSIFSEIRERAREVAARALWVSINDASLMLYPEIIEMISQVDLSHTAEHHLLGRGDDTLSFFVLLDTINFGSGYFPFIEKSGGPSGYYAIATRLKRYIESEGAPSPTKLTEVDGAWCLDIFGQSRTNRHAVELMELFAVAFRTLGRWMRDKGMHSYTDILEGVSTADEFVRRLGEMETFADRTLYRGVEVPFFKRAQILVQDLAIALPRSSVASFPDLNELTIFADNVLPYVLRVDGVIEVDAWLEGRIEREELIGAGSCEEVELRACTLHAVERLRDLIQDDGRALSVREIDFYLWMRGQELKKRSPTKRHRTRTIYY